MARVRNALLISACATLVAACGSKSSAGSGGEAGATTSSGGAAGTTASSGGRSGAGATSSANGGAATAGSGAAGGTGPSPEAGPAPVAGLHLFFSDLTSGPNSGGQGSKGAFVTLYGNGFGASQGASTVTVGGGAVDNYPVWTNTKITVQLGAAAKTGDLVVHVAAKGDSNALPFTVRSGNIYFVAPGGDDTNDGSFATPWATIPHAKDSLAAGDIAYLGAKAGDTLSQTTENAFKAGLSMDLNDGANSGTEAAPKALVIYPGASATIGVENNLERGILAPAITGTFDYWVIAGLTLRGTAEAMDLESPVQGWRVIGNDLSCPNGSGLTGCVTGNPIDLKFYGNVMHDAAASVTTISKYYHGIYFGSSHLDLGWNVVRDGKTCRAIQFHDTGGPNEFDVHVHDNLIHGTVCDGINFSTMDPSQGTVEAYNNVIYDVGRGPDPVEASADYAGIYVYTATDNDGSIGSGTVQLYNNTLYDCGSLTTNSSASAFNRGDDGNPGLLMDLQNNLVVALTGERTVIGPAALITGGHNLLFGGGAAPSGLTNTVTGDPLLSNAAGFDFHLEAGSPALGAGVDTTATSDFDGNPRPAGAFDIGAYQATQ